MAQKYTSTSQRKYRKMFRKGKSEFMLKCSGRLNGKMPKSEQWFRALLEDYGLYKRFKKNTPIYHLEIIPDLHDKEYMIVIEVDGSIHRLPEVIKRDAVKDQKYKDAGYTVFRVIHGDEDGAYKVMDALVELYKTPSKKQMKRIERKKTREAVKGMANRVPLTKEESDEAVLRILGTKKTIPGKFYK